MKLYELYDLIDVHMSKNHVLKLLRLLREKYPNEVTFRGYDNLDGSTKWEKLNNLFEVIESYNDLAFLAEAIIEIKPDDVELVEQLNLYITSSLHSSPDRMIHNNPTEFPKGSSFHVFLCHNNEDKSLVKEIAIELIARNITPWLDEWELRPGLPWQRVLEKEMGNIPTVAVFVGNSGIGPWQQMEIDGFLREFVERDEPCSVIPVILPNCKEVPKLPVFLKGMMWVDFRKKDPDPMQQLVWGITGQRD